MQGTNKDRAVAKPCGRGRTILLEKRGRGWVAGRRERQRAVARSVVKSPPTVGIPSWFEPGYCLQVLGMNEDRASRCRAADDDFFCWSNGVLGGWQVEERDRGQWRGMGSNRSLFGNPSWVEPDSCLQVLGTYEDGAYPLSRGRQRPAFV